MPSAVFPAIRPASAQICGNCCQKAKKLFADNLHATTGLRLLTARQGLFRLFDGLRRRRADGAWLLPCGLCLSRFRCNTLGWFCRFLRKRCDRDWGCLPRLCRAAPQKSRGKGRGLELDRAVGGARTTGDREQPAAYYRCHRSLNEFGPAVFCRQRTCHFAHQQFDPSQRVAVDAGHTRGTKRPELGHEAK